MWVGCNSHTEDDKHKGNMIVNRISENYFNCIDENYNEIDIYFAHGCWTACGQNGYYYHRNFHSLEEAMTAVDIHFRFDSIMKIGLAFVAAIQMINDVTEALNPPKPKKRLKKSRN